MQHELQIVSSKDLVGQRIVDLYKLKRWSENRKHHKEAKRMIRVSLEHRKFDNETKRVASMHSRHVQAKALGRRTEATRRGKMAGKILNVIMCYYDLEESRWVA